MISCIYENLWCVVLPFFAICYLICNFIIDNFTISNGAGKTILVTGCDSGFGYAAALKLNESNCKVFAGCLTQNGVDRLQNEKEFQGQAFIMDVTKDEDVEKAKELIEKDGGLDGIVNNAGIADVGLIEWKTIDQMKKVIDVNYWGTVRTAKAMLPFLKKSKGRVVNVASIAGRFPLPYAASYTSSKFATEAFSDCLRLEMKPWGVSVHVIEPTYHRTEIVNEDRLSKLWDDIYIAQPLEVREQFPEEHFKQFVAKYYDAIPFTESIEGVSNCIQHALLSYLPRRRYVTGKLGTGFVIITHLPTVIQDLVAALLQPRLSPIKCEKEKSQ